MKLKDLAAELGLSQTTVSRALNGFPEVNEATRQRVNEAARRLGYRANVSAQRLATGRAGAIGVALPLQRSQHFGPHTAEFLSGIGERLAQYEIDIVVTPLDVDDEIPLYRRLAASKRVDAVVLSAPTPDDKRIAALTELGMPFFVHGRCEVPIPHAWLDIDNEGAFRRATSHLIDLGHRRIAMINGPVDQTFAIHRDRGFRAAFAAHGLTPDPALIAGGGFTDENGFRLAQAFLERTPRPTAFLAGSMMTALGVFRAIRLAGFELGKDVSMIAHDDVFPYLNADNMVPSMSTTRSSIRAAGARIAELLLQMQEGKPPASIHELWPVELVLRESTGPAPK
ncbi:substrate-binding domain-containing protein [Devosia sp.]|uniref:substrate-binding domain-containing protein n=1 Tax=Devosia sp. TaxID=1871048 RepID=UPI00262F64D6|nr:substrate-binding domain-containing protein [Devosia sp.]